MHYQKITLLNITKNVMIKFNWNWPIRKKITRNLKIRDTLKTLPLKDAHIMMKDNNKNFLTYPKCWLINPSEFEVDQQGCT